MISALLEAMMVLPSDTVTAPSISNVKPLKSVSSFMSLASSSSRAAYATTSPRVSSRATAAKSTRWSPTCVRVMYAFTG